ncbi:hypothetical protein IW261DRAFT_1413625 [Armillaria novae-zelandiae]|uniref:Uncharacterized protein n=1 Tax=Armillaria novae-zelandiae TaxID=153914 RepID=A0AA39PW72_9AGAR|nr:hypothetical protein IW261DRAFT_1413625 [Armillaria novae-zelandiae]
MFPESMPNQDPHVLAAVMFGRRKYQIGVLVKPGPQFSFDSVDGNLRLRSLIKDIALMIIVTKPSRPLVYTANNTVRRQAVLDDYRAEIATLYETVEDCAI